MADIKIKIAEKLLPLIEIPKREKIIVGGRGGSKSIAVGDIFLRYCDAGERLCCSREYQNSIDESVHAQLTARIPVLGCDNTLHPTASKIFSDAGGEIFYRGLARNILGFKSTFGIKRMWIEEGQGLSANTIETVIPTIREDDSEIWITANRGNSNDAFSKHYLKPYERQLRKNKGYYEDDDILIIEINWPDNPFFPETLNKQRIKDKKMYPPAKYDNIWGGNYADTVDGAIIFTDWFDACVDAHKKIKGWEPEGVEVVAHDPSDQGADPKALAYRHGSVIVDCQLKEDGDVNEGADWAIDYALMVNCDEFIWDIDGVGAALKRDFGKAFNGKTTRLNTFRGGGKVDYPEKVYEPLDGEIKKATKHKDLFYNLRAQYYWDLRDRCYRTYQAIVHGVYTDPCEMISFASDIEDLDILRAEICSIPKKPNGAGKIQIVSKEDMKKPPYKLDSPNMSDCVMMSLRGGQVKQRQKASSGKSNRSSGWQGA